MIDKYISINRILRSIIRHCVNALQVESLGIDDEGHIQTLMQSYVEDELRELKQLWPKGLSTKSITRLKNLIGSEEAEYRIIDELKNIEDEIDLYYSNQDIADISINILAFLHPVIITSSYEQFRSGHYREAVFNAFVSLFDFIRQKTGLATDGATLVAEAFSLNNPKLVISDLVTETGQNEQKGMIQMLQGAYQAIRNPKAHSLGNDTDQLTGALNLVFASMLARRIDAAQVIAYNK